MTARNNIAQTPRRPRTLDDAPGRNLRAKRTNSPLSHIDLTSARGRRIADLAAAYSEALENPNDVACQTAIVAAAELTVIAEEARALALADPAKADLDGLVRAQNAVDRSIRRLGIRSTAKRDDEPSLAEVLARHRDPGEGNGS